MEEQETVHGYEIPIRPLNEEEKSRDITPERIRNYETTVGESFLDGHSSLMCIDTVIGFFLARYPEKAVELIRVGNEKFREVLSLEEIFVPEWDEEENNKFLQTICDYVNLTVKTKARINQVLIQIDEHYNK